MATRVGMLDAQRFSIKAGADAVYDQICKPGEFLKEGESVTFDHSTLSSMVRNFSKQKNPLPADVEHQLCYVPMNGQPAPLAARYDSLVLVEGGKVTAYHSQTGASAPDVAGWEDGLFGRRSEVTPFGRDLLDNKGYGFISPTFMTDGLDAQGNEQGYTLLSASWVNLPFLDGMQPVTFARLGAPSAVPVTMARVGDVVVDSSSNRRGRVIRKNGMDWTIQWQDGSVVVVGPGVLDVGMGTESDPHVFSSATPGAHAMAVDMDKQCSEKNAQGFQCQRPSGHDGDHKTSGASWVNTMSAAPSGATCQWNSDRSGTACGKPATERVTINGEPVNYCAEHLAKVRGLLQNVGMSAAPTRAGKGATTMALFPGARVRIKTSASDVYNGQSAVVVRPDNYGGWWVKIDGASRPDQAYPADELIEMSSTSAPTRRFNQGAPMDPEKMAARFGFEPNDDAETKLAKCMAGLADEEVKAMGELEIVHKDEEDEKEAEAMAADLGVEPGPKMMSRMRAALNATRAPVTAMAALQGEVKALSAKLAERDKADADAKLNAFATDAINAGQWDPEKREALITFARADMKAAQSSLLPAGTYTALARITASLDSRGNAGGAVPDANGVQRFGVKLSDAAKKFARDNKVSFEKALAEVAKDPALASDYIAR